MSDQPVVLQYTSADAGQPPGSRVRAEHGAEGVTFVVPPEVTVSDVIALLVSGVLVILCILGIIALAWSDGSVEVIALLALTASIFSFLIPASIRTMTRATIITVENGCLTLLHAASIFGKQRSWPAARIEEMQVPFRGLSLHGRTNGDLQVKPKGSMAVNLLTGRDRAEMRWMAHEISLALHRADEAAAPIPVVAINEPQTVQDSTSEPPSPDNSLI